MKPRSDNKLAALPGPQKNQLRTWLVDENRSYEEVKELLRQKYEVRTSTGALCKFYATSCYELRVDEANSFAAETVKAGRASVASLDEATARIIQQRAFEHAYARNGDLNALAVLSKILGDRKKLELKAADQALTERRIKILETKAAQADAAKGVTADLALSPAEREAKLKEIFGLR
jgi:hypothetical protein